MARSAQSSVIMTATAFFRRSITSHLRSSELGCVKQIKSPGNSSALLWATNPRVQYLFQLWISTWATRERDAAWLDR
jgi:hypothetical protein